MKTYCSAATRHQKKVKIKCQSPASESTNALTNIEVSSIQRNQDKEKYGEVCGKRNKQKKIHFPNHCKKSITKGKVPQVKTQKEI